MLYKCPYSVCLILLDDYTMITNHGNEELEVLSDHMEKGDNPDVTTNALKVERESFKLLMCDTHH